jgi:hypothetical protein
LATIAIPMLWRPSDTGKRFSQAGELIGGWLFLSLPVIGIAAPLGILWLANRVALSL